MPEQTDSLVPATTHPELPAAPEYMPAVPLVAAGRSLDVLRPEPTEDVNVTDDLKREGVARDFINRVQNLRKDLGLAVLDKINIEVERNGEVLTSALTSYREYISTETQALTLELKDKVADAEEVDMDDFMMRIKISVYK